MTTSLDACLRAAVWDDSAARRVVADLPTELVEGPERTRTLAAIAALVDSGVPVDPPTVLARVITDQQPGWDDAARWLPDLIGGPPLAGTLGWHLERLTEQAARIRLSALAVTVQQAAAGPDLHDAVQTVRDRLDRVDLGAATVPPSLADLTDAYLQRLETQDHTRTLSTGFADLDRLLGGGLRPGQLVVVGARPGVGKSVLLGDLARAAAGQGARVLWHSLEMDRHEVLDRHAAAVARVPLDRLIARSLTDADWSRVVHALELIAERNLHVEDRPAVTVGDIARQARGVHPDLLIVDYLQLVQPSRPSGSRQEDVAGLSRGLKLLARDLRCPVVVAAQLNRALTGRSDTRPRMSDLRESGAIEADADVVVLLDRSDDDETQGTTARLLVEKNRSGPTGLVDLAFLGHYATFGSLDWSRHEEAS